MSRDGSRMTIAKPTRPNGVLVNPAHAAQRKSSRSNGESNAMRASNVRLKLVIRRLPPGLTRGEFEDALGGDWKVGGDLVDWAMYKPGKVSTDPAKPSRPSRAYIHATKQENIGLLSDHVRSTTFDDARRTAKDSCLMGPPSVEFAPYGRVPSGRSRKDGRQSTIEQDPDFIDFLESLTNPITKTPQADQETQGPSKKDKVTVTPLVQYLKDRKANKGKKENAPPQKDSKNSRQESKEGKAPPIGPLKGAAVTGQMSGASPKKQSAQAVKVEQVARDAVKAVNKSVSGTRSKQPSSNVSQPPKPTTPNVTPNSTANAALASKQRERGSASAAARILQRDLGLASGRGGRGGKAGSTSRASTVQTTPNSKQASGPVVEAKPTEIARSTPAAEQSEKTGTPNHRPAVPPPTGPAAIRGSGQKASTISSKSMEASTSTQAFLKHANPSQGVTEPLLEEAFKQFGAVKKVEIDKKKGFAYVDFTEAGSLQKAIAASPIKVGQGQVVVLELKSRQPSVPTRNVRNTNPIPMNRGSPPMNMRGNGNPRPRSGVGRGAANVPQSAKPAPKSAAGASKMSTIADNTANASRSGAP